jgi:1,4-alpha-glucan branching enzyme
MASQIEFQLFAPYNKGAALIGSFSDWKDIPMEKGEDGYFRTQVELEDGVYQYKFRVQSKSWFFEPINGLKSLTPTPQTSMTPAKMAMCGLKMANALSIPMFGNTTTSHYLPIMS